MDIKRIKNKIIINSYRITFEYETRKGLGDWIVNRKNVIR